MPSLPGYICGELRGPFGNLFLIYSHAFLYPLFPRVKEGICPRSTRKTAVVS